MERKTTNSSSILTSEEKRLYESTLTKYKDERDAIQKKTFTKWVNKHLKKTNRHVTDLFTDLQDGLNLISLLEVLTGEHLQREKGRMRFHALQNVELVLNFLRYKKIKLVNIRPEDIVDGNPKLTLGLIWTIILHFQISDIVVGEEPNVSAKDVLLRWARKSTHRYPDVKVNDFTSSWRDGLAFNAIIHRNRPDLLNWREVRQRNVRERLETAFYTAEKVGVTRLLDPEDVDTHEIDEKSIITYVSSLFDAFPDPPAVHPLYDNEAQSLTNEYREVASSLHMWIKEKTSFYSERTLPGTLSDLVHLVKECNKFRTIEAPSKMGARQELARLYTDLQKIYESTGEVEIEPELHIDVLERGWNKMMTLHSEREQQLQDEIKKFERLDRLADRLSRDCKRVDSRLDDVESRVKEEAKRLDRIHPLDAKRNADSIESEMRNIEETIQSMNQDLGTLKAVGHQAWPSLDKKVTKLHQKWVSLRSMLHQKLIARLASMSFPVVEERTVTRQTRTVLETRLVDTNHHFRSLQQAIEWCNNKLKQLQDNEYGNDLAGVKIELAHHQRDHKEIDRFQQTVEQCAQAKNQFQGEEQSLYIQHLNTLHKVYSELLTTSNKRLSDLESLLDFLQSLQNQLTWLREKENVEVGRDWSDPNINLANVEAYHDSLMSELEKREVSVRSVIERGNALSLQGHPASKTISRWNELLKETWSRLLQFSLACEVHTLATRKYQEYMRDIREAEAWLQSRDELLNTVYSASEFSLDEGERLLKGMQELREELNSKAAQFAELASRAASVPPIKQRRLPVARPIQITAVCNYNSDSVLIEKDDTWLLHDNSALTHWRVSNLSNRTTDTNVPSVVFLIPPPGKEPLEAAERLNRAFERTTSLWQRKQTRLRQNMIFATIRVVRSWDLAQFIGMGPDQRSAIRRALNEDADKLLAEGDPSDPQLRRLRREMDEVNRLFDEFERRARLEDEQKVALREFTEHANNLQSQLDEFERVLNQRISSSIARDTLTLEHMVLQHKEFETDLKSLTPQIESLQTSYNALPRKTQQLQVKVENILQQWNTIWNYSHLYVERLKCIEIVLASLDEAKNVVSELEIKLVSFGEMPTDLEPLRNVHDDLIRLQNAIAARQPVVDQLIDDATNVRRVVVHSRDRTNEREHVDLDRLDDEVNNVTRRWNELCANLVERLRSCESAFTLLEGFGKTYQTEVKFIDESYTQLNDLPPVSNAKHHIEPTKVLFTSIVERTQPLEQVNIDGGRFIREAKIYSVALRKYTERVAMLNPSYDPGERTPNYPLIEEALDTLNTRYLTLVSVMQDRLRQMSALTGDKELQEFVAMLKPLELRTFRTVFSVSETAKQISSRWKENGTSTADMGNQINGRPREETGIGTVGPESGQEIGLIDPITGQELSVADAIRLRILDVRSGTLNTKNGPIELATAAKMGLLEKRLADKLLGPVPGGGNLLEAIQRELSAAETPNVSQNIPEYGLHDCYNLNLVKFDPKSDENPTILDRESGHFVSLHDAIRLSVVNPNVFEIFTTDSKITLNQALKDGIPIVLNQIQKPLTLKDAIDLNLYSENSISTPIGNFSVEDSVAKNVLDTKYSTIFDPKSNSLVTLEQALESKLIQNGQYFGQTEKPLEMAASDGDFRTVSILSIFDIGLVRIDQEYKSLNWFIDSDSFDNGRFQIGSEKYSLDDLDAQNLLRNEVKDLLRKKIGVKSNGKELNVFEAVSLGLLDPKLGLLMRKGRKIGFEEALRKKLITREGLATLKSILAITLTTQTKTVRKYVDSETFGNVDPDTKKLVSEEVKVVEKSKKSIKQGVVQILDALMPKKAEVMDRNWLLREAILKGVFDPKKGVFLSKNVETPFRSCIENGIISPDSGRVVVKNRVFSFKKALDKKIMDDFGRINGNNMEDCIKNGTIILDDASPDPIQVEPGVIFDPSSSLVILTDSGQSVKFADAIKNGQLDTNKIRIHGLTIQEAIENKIVNEDLSEFDSPEGRMSVADAIRKGFIAVEGKSLTTPKNASDSVDMGKLKSALTLAVAAPLAPLALGKMLYDAVKKEKPLTVDKFLTPKELALRGAYDAKTGRFLNSGKEADFDDVCQIFDADTVVKDLSTGKFVPLSVAKQTLVDKSGNMTDPQTGRVVPFFQAVKMGWIASKKSSRPKPMMTLMEAVLDEILDPDGILTLDGEKFEIGSAVLDGILDPNEIQVKDRKEYIPIEQAVEVGLVDLVQNRFGTTTLTEGFKNGLVRNRDPPISLVAVIRNFGDLVDPLTSKPIKLVESIDRRIVDPEISLVQIDDNVWSPIEASLPKNDIPQEILDDLKTALQENKIKTEMEPKSLIDLILGRYYRPKTGQILDPRTGFTVTVRTGLQNGLIDPSKTKFRDPKNDQILNFDQAGELLDPEKGILTYPNKMTLDVAYRKGYILPSEPPMTLPEAVLQGLAQDGGLILRGKVISLRKSLETGQILDNPCLVFENELVTPSEAIENGAMDPETGNFRGLPLDKALLAGFLVPKKTFTIKEAIEAGIYSPKSGLFNGGITTATAIRLGLLDPETTIVRTESGPEIFKNVADTSTGRISTPKGELNFEQALQKGILTDIPKPLGLAQAFDEIFVNGRFLDPKTGRYLTLSQAVDEELIDGDSKIKTGSEVLPLKLALAQNLIDPSKLEQMRDAVIEEPKESGVALQFLLKNSLYSPESGKLLISGKELSLNRAIRESKVDPERALCLGPDGKLVSLKEAILENKIDPRLGQFVEQNLSIPLDAAMDLELIHDLDNIGLYEAVVGGVQDSEKINPDISRLRGPDAKYVSLKEARSLNLVPEDLEQAVLDGSLVPSKTPMDLEVALKSKLMVPQGFVDPTTNAVNSLQKSVNKMVINPKTTLLKAKTLDVALEENLVGPDGVKQIEGVVPLEEAFQSGILKTVPESLQHRAARLKIALKAKCKLHDAISCGFLDPKSSTVKNVGPLTKMLESGRISLDAAGVMDTIEGTFTGDDFVVVQGIAVSFMDAIKTGRLDPESGLYQGEKKLSIREAVNAGILDPNSLILKDTARRRFVKFPEAFKRGIVDERGNVLDRANSKLYNLKSGLENQIVYVEKISILDALDCGVYNPTNGLFTDPFTAEIGLSRKRLDLSASLGSGLLDGNSAFVKTENGQILTVKDAIAKGILDVEHGRYKLEGGESIDLIKAKDRGLIIRSENRQAMEEKYKLCDDSLRQLLDWITEIEIRLANQEPANEHLDGIRNQINLLKLIKEELDSQTRTVSAAQDDVRTIVTTGAEYLARDEIASVEKSSKILRTKYDRAQATTDRLLRRLGSAAEELNKFRSETQVFSDWLEKAKRLASEKERSVGAGLRQSDVGVVELTSDVIAHQADLRFISMASQKFLDESKEFLMAVNEYRTQLSSRPSLVEPLSGSELRQLVQELTREYKDLLNRVNNLSDRLSSLSVKTKEYKAALDRVRHWMNSAEPAANKILSEPLAADPASLDEQLNRAKVLNTEFSAQSRLFDNLRQTLDTLLRSIEGQASRSEINELSQPVDELTTRYEHIHGALKGRIAALDNALEQSQGVESSLESVISWLSTAENTIKALTRPASLNKNRLDDQIRSLRGPLADIQSHGGQIESVATQARQLVAQATNARLAKRIDTKMKDMLSRYEKLLERATKLNESLAEVNVSLDDFNKRAQDIESWLNEASDGIATGAAQSAIDAIANDREAKRDSIERVLRDGRNLIGRKDVTDTSHVRDRIKNIETQWRELNLLLDEKSRLSKLRAEQSLAYDKLRDQVVQWLNSFEGKISRLEQVALHMDIIRRQTDELKPLVKEHRDYAPTIDRLFDLGSALEALDSRSESPTRRRSSVSPVKRISSLGRRSSQDLTSPSPTKLYASMTSPLSPGSSGFGSRRSSQEAFHLEDGTGVQQEMAEINNRYSTLGVRLSERSAELENVRDELKKVMDHLKTLDAFIERTLRALPRDTLPNTREEADKMNKVVKGLLEEMYEKQSLLDNTKTSVSELLRKKSNAPGSDALAQQLNDVAAKWKNLSDLCKSRIQLLEDLKDLYDTHDHLATWLSAKERMTAALGPISSDPRMVQSQVEQVQVLREELRAMGPQLSHLEDTTSALVSRAKWTPLEAKLKSVQDRWSALAKKLDDRAANLGAAVDSTKEFDLGLSRLRDTLQNISDQIDSATAEKDPEQHLRRLQACERQLEGARQLLADAEAAGEQLCKVLTDAASRADIQAKLAAVNKQYNALQAKLDQRKAEIEGYLRDGREFDATVAKTLGWLSEELGSLSDRLLISADRDILQQQVEAHEPIYKDVLAKEHQIIMLLDKGASQQQKSTEKHLSSRSLDNLRNQWDRLKREAVERQTRLATSMEHCRKYYKALESFVPWLSQAENRLDALRPDSFARRDLDKHLQELAAFRNDLWKKSGEFEHLRSLGETFVASCDIDKDIVVQELSAAKARWDKLNNELLGRISSLEELGRRIADASDRLGAVTSSVQRCEYHLNSHDTLPTHTDAATLSRLSTLRDEVLALRKPLDSLRSTCADLDDEIARVGRGKTSGLSDEVKALSERLDDLTNRLDDRCDRAQVAAKAVQQYNEKVKHLMTDLTGLEDELNSMKPPGRDMKTLRNQQDQLAAFNTKVNRAADDVGAMMALADSLVDSGFSADATRQQAENVSKRLALIEAGSRRREEALEDALERLKDFIGKADEANQLVDAALDEIKHLKPVGSEPETIRNQQEEATRLRRDIIEPAGQSVDVALASGQVLAGTAAPGVSTAAVEKECEKLAEKWASVKERMVERERRLDVGLLQSGKFQEAVEGLSKWLTDTEEMVANQRPPSSDYKVVKAQLQEQKFLKKMLLDRQGSMSSLVAMGREVAANCDAAERAGIERQLRSLAERFEDLSDKAATRMTALEQAMGVAKEFQDKLNPIVDWLDRTEKKIKDMELVPTDEEKIQQKIREHNALHDDILRQKNALSDLTEVASELAGLVGEDEAAAVADKVQEVADRYSNLVEASEGISTLLEAARGQLRHLVVTYQQLQAWMQSMENRLAKYKVLAVHTEQLLAQMEDLADLTEEISNQQGSVDSTVDAGLELMRNISSDEAIQLKDKLDSLQRRYNQLTTKGADLLKQTQEALPLVQQFHHAHNRLADWMHGAETTLQQAEPREESIQALEMDIKEFKPVLENINQLGPQLCAIGPGEGAATIEGLVTRDNRRFDAIAQQIQRKAERLRLCKQRSLEVLGDVDSLLEWFREVEAQLREAEPPSSEPHVIRLQLKEHKALNDDIASQKGRVRDVLDTAKKVLRESPQYEDNSLMRDKMADLRETMDSVWASSGDRLSLLEQALALAQHFDSSHSELVSWLEERENEAKNLRPSMLRPQALMQDQAVTQRLLQSISEHKPLVDKLNKTGEALIKLVQYDEGQKVQEILDSDNQRYTALRNLLKARQEALEKALQESSEFSDKLEGMLRALTNAADEMSSAEPVSAHVPKIKQQLKENKSLVDEIAKREDAFEAIKRAAADVIAKSPSDPAVKDINRKMDKLQQLWNDVNAATKSRNQSLNDALEVAARFWSQLEAVVTALAEIEQSLLNQEPPALRPEEVQAQADQLDNINHEINQTKPRVEEVRKTGAKLMSLVGDPEKPEVRKNIEDLDSAWDTVTSLFAKRRENLIDAMERAMEFHDMLRSLKEFLKTAEARFSALGPLGEDINTIRAQMKEVKDLKAFLDPMMVKVESLNRQAAELTERSSAEQAQGLKEDLSRINSRWDELHRGIAERYRQLENALLRLGQFQQAVSELLAWIAATDRTLDTEMYPIAVDPHQLEIQLAKLKVLMNDMTAHQTSVDTLNDAGRQIIEEGRGKDDSVQDKLKDLNVKWKALLSKATNRQTELEEALRQGHRFSAEVQDLLSWLGEVDSVIAASKPVGGLPETASEQLERFMVVYNELEDSRPRVEGVLSRGNEMLKKSTSTDSTNHLAQSLKTLKTRWESVTARANDKKIKLEIALKEATEFHDALQNFVDWLTSAEKTLSNLKPVSRVLETILSQIEDHKSFQKEVGQHREAMVQLDRQGTHLKYFCQKQDVILIKNLLVSVQHRWERVVSKSAERTRALDHGYKEAKDYHDSWSSMISWLGETDKKLDEISDEITAAANDPAKLKHRLAKHRETQKAIAAKQGQYDTTMRNGKVLRERAPKSDETTLKNMAAQLKDLWNTVCAKAVERQRSLEEALLYCGQVKDALEALLDWLRKTHRELSADSPVHGDLDTVQMLIEQHKNLEQELESRRHQVDSVAKSGRELTAKGDTSGMAGQIHEMSKLWEETVHLAQRRGVKLQGALRQAEELHRAVNMLLEWLSDAEMKLRFVDSLPDDEIETRAQITEHEKFMRELRDKEREKDATVRLAEEILAKAHPDGASVVKHWITIIQSRWEEVTSWARQRRDVLEAQLRALQDMDSLLAELLAWTSEKESTLIGLEHQDLPNEIPPTERLIEEHTFFMEDMAKRTAEVDTVIKAKTIKERKQSTKKVSKDETRQSTTELHEIQRRQSISLRSSKEQLSTLDRRSSRASPTKDAVDSGLPHIGPKFPAKGSKTPEPQFKCARSRMLYDRWRSVWLLSWDRQRRLNEHLAHLRELERLANFSWDDWRKRFLKFNNHKKTRLTDLFRKMDKNNDGLIPRDDFIDGIIKTKFDTNKLEMGAVADMFDHNSEGYIDWKEFIAALRPDWEEKKPVTEADKIHDEVKRLVMLCTCRQKFRVFQVGEGKYRFGDSQKLRLVRILRSTVMVRVGGGWVALEEFLVKNDPCRAKGRTNIELREQFILADNVSQSMSAFKPKLSTERKTPTPTSNTGPITKVREKSSRSVPMTPGSRGSRGSLSDVDTPGTSGTPGGLGTTPRRPSSLRPSSASALGLGGSSLPGSRSNSRPASRQGSKPPSRHGSSLSLASSDDGTPSRIPRRSVPSRTPSSAGASSTSRKLTAPSTVNGSSSPSTRTPKSTSGRSTPKTSR
ncbi:Growth-Arrest-Specific Protein 2 Domain [Nesidiocoris tenuis]|uniref:Growth-Arrest-Specific Protein 2 Domain n=1 Tax=Nesidiocoris tenuis TaxID=355587 RepID=A0ABN7BAX9_9HEMI|nr:Growth-Arrest-Specific Protein 2 Domain [Nesidiocoris tenuis]